MKSVQLVEPMGSAAAATITPLLAGACMVSFPLLISDGDPTTGRRGA